MDGKIYSLTRRDLTVNGHDWHILAGNDETMTLFDLHWECICSRVKQYDTILSSLPIIMCQFHLFLLVSCGVQIFMSTFLPIDLRNYIDCPNYYTNFGFCFDLSNSLVLVELNLDKLNCSCQVMKILLRQY